MSQCWGTLVVLLVYASISLNLKEIWGMNSLREGMIRIEKRMGDEVLERNNLGVLAPLREALWGWGGTKWMRSGGHCYEAALFWTGMISMTPFGRNGFLRNLGWIPLELGMDGRIASQRMTGREIGEKDRGRRSADYADFCRLKKKDILERRDLRIEK